MYKLTLLFLLFTFLSSTAQEIIQADPLIKEEGVRKKIQWSCNEKGEECWPQIIYEYDENGCLIKKETFDKGNLVEANRYEYNTHFFANNVYTQVGNGKEYLQVKYTYDSKNRLVLFQACYPNGNCEPFEKYTYRADGKLLSRTRYKDGKYFYEYKHKYDAQGRNIEILILSKDSDSGEREVKKYDAQGRHVQSKWIDYRGEEIDNAEYTYDEAGRLLKNQWIGGLSTQKLYQYDELGNNTKYTSIDYNAQIDDERTMTYQGKLIQSRVQTDGKKIINYWKFTYE
ncbi:hypothetical protein Lbys_2924 [Leadbetterella byssophila DSM 17132]|uniref:YD repeat protein n=1 Tax=Leadbetterella byssophila (strain DSM 17132 / JCM 16389 / KACC 11308 / NBRC 106382 / 4M15) TaxID=649349 RepID=E4RSL6_LEAB4|nr:hypothetical protein [Leadbetterella byssophila]ADQ18586.1 hypothetical protein Lbys_2924 [Leadbetterella byssophila DSM 17132]